MLLPTKIQIQEHKSKERQLDIEQGLSFARKIDALRETKEKETLALEKYRKDSSESLKREISEAMSKRDTLLEEVKVLEEKRSIAKKPLDEEWVEVRKREENLATLEKSLVEAFIKSEENKSYLFKRNMEISESIEKCNRDTKRTALALQEAESDRIQAKKLLEDTELKVREVTSMLLSREKKTIARETAVSAKERDMDIRQKSMDRRNLELNARETEINDKYKTLERTINRLK